MTEAEAPTARATLGRRLRFVELASDAPPPDPTTDVVVLDTAWTPSSDDRPDLHPLRETLHAVFAAVDLFAETQLQLDDWAARASAVERFTVDGVSWWFRVRMVVRWGLHERLIWSHVLASLLTAGHTHVEVPRSRPALADVALAVAHDRPLKVELVGEAIDQKRRRRRRRRARLMSVAGARSVVRRVARGVRRRLRPIVGWRPPITRKAIVAQRRAVLDDRMERLLADAHSVLSVASARFFQVIRIGDRDRFADPHLALVLDRLASTGVPHLTVALASDERMDTAWAYLAADDRLVPRTTVASRWAIPDDRSAQVSVVAASIAEAADVPLVVVGCDLGPWLHGAVATHAGAWLEGQLRWSGWAERFMADLRPRALFIDHEGVRTLWMAAARRLGIPIIAVQHGIINRHNMEYLHDRQAGLLIPDLTCVYGPYERQILLEFGGYRPDEVVITGSSRADPNVSRLPATPTERDDVRRELGVRAEHRMLVVSVAHNPVAGDMYSVERVASLLGGPMPGIHVVFKLHPRERSNAPYEAVLEGLARARGYEPPAMSSVRDFDLYRLLRSADAHLGFYSTVLTDAIVAGTPNLIAVGQAFGDMLDYIPSRVAVPVASVEELRAFMRDPRPLDPLNREAFLALHFQAGDTTGRIVDALNSLPDPADLRRATDRRSDQPAAGQ